MSAQPQPPPHAPLSADKGVLLERLVDGLDRTALWWLSGYAAGLAGRTLESIANAPREIAASPRASIVYGSQTGNARRVAERLAGELEADGLAVRLIRADAYSLRQLATESLLYVVISTQGDGDPPDDARAFVEHLSGRRAPALADLRYAVLGLGDSSYPHFNAVGQRLDARLAELGAQRLFDRGDADLDIDGVATPWARQALEHARRVLPGPAARAVVVPLRATPTPPAASREQPFAAEILANQRITGRGSAKNIRHLEISLAGSGLHYEPGDALGVWPRNDAALVADVIDVLGLDAKGLVAHRGAERTLGEWLTAHCELTRLARPFVAAHAALRGDDALNRLLAPSAAPALTTLLGSHQLIDLLREYPVRWGADELVGALRPLAPRLYSIASSRKQVGDEVHLTVAEAAWHAFGHDHRGVASGHLADALDGARLPVYIEPNERFRLPADPSRDIIMIGPGTGVAPFRGFLQERTAVGASGRHWLLFGNPYVDSEFLYQLEWQDALREGRLQRLDLAFSRDQAERIHVTLRLRENGRALYDWLERGAHLYVCGDATRMARDVHAALLDIIATHAGLDRERAAETLQLWQQQGRYARDVY